MGSLESRSETVLVCPGFIGRYNHSAVKALLSSRLVKGMHSPAGDFGSLVGHTSGHLSQWARLLEYLFISSHQPWVEGYFQGLRGSRDPSRSSAASSQKILVGMLRDGGVKEIWGVWREAPAVWALVTIHVFRKIQCMKSTSRRSNLHF